MHWRLGLILLSALTTTALLASRFLGGPVQAGPLGAPMGTAFTYQGQIRLSSVPVNGTCDFQFSLYDAPSGGGLVAGPVAANGVPVANGLFTTMLDFGAGAFNGDARWLEIAASCPGGGGGFTTLAQRQALTPTPYALFAQAAASATTLLGALAGDVTGTQGATSVVRVRGVPVSGTAPQGGQVLKYNAATAQWEPSADGTGADWTLTGNVGTTPGTNFLGTTNNVALELKVNGQRALRLEPTFFSPNLVGGHSGNAVAGTVGATIAGGGANASTNSVTDNFGTVGGGYANQAGNGGTTIDNVAATVAGGHNNTASGHRAIVGGGGYNQATELAATVAGGDENVASGQSSAVGGGHLNVASGSHATIGGGGLNKATRDNATVAGGAFNQAGGDVGGPATGSNATVGGGDHNVASGTAATVPGGAENRAQGQYSLAAGQRAKADHFGTFVWADGNGVDLLSTGSNQFIVRAAGGLWLGTTSAVPAAGMVPNGRFIDTSTGAYLSNSGVWTDVSDRDAKTDFAPVDRQALLRQVAALPVGTWRYKTDASDVRHLGPVAQDFHAAFGLGDSDKHLAALDTSGVALAAVQGLHELVQERDAEVAALREEGAVQQAQIAALEARLTALERTSVREPAASGAGWSLVGVVGLVLAGAVIGPRYRASPRQ